MGQGDQAGRDQGERIARSTGQGDPKQSTAPKDIPTLVVFGDNIALDSRWPQIRKNGVDFVGEIPLPLNKSSSGVVEAVPRVPVSKDLLRTGHKLRPVPIPVELHRHFRSCWRG